MFLVKEISDEAKQKHTLILPDGSSLTMIVEYKPMQLGWFITQLQYKTFEINNIRIVTSPNMLHQFKNRIPFGIGIFVTDNQEPVLQGDFLSGRAQMFILSAAEVAFFTEVLSGQIPS